MATQTASTEARSAAPAPATDVPVAGTFVSLTPTFYTPASVDQQIAWAGLAMSNRDMISYVPSNELTILKLLLPEESRDLIITNLIAPQMYISMIVKRALEDFERRLRCQM